MFFPSARRGAALLLPLLVLPAIAGVATGLPSISVLALPMGDVLAPTLPADVDEGVPTAVPRLETPFAPSTGLEIPLEVPVQVAARMEMLSDPSLATPPRGAAPPGVAVTVTGLAGPAPSRVHVLLRLDPAFVAARATLDEMPVPASVDQGETGRYTRVVLTLPVLPPGESSHRVEVRLVDDAGQEWPLDPWTLTTHVL